MRQQKLPGRLDPDGVAREQIGAECVVEHPFPRVQLERVPNRTAVPVYKPFFAYADGLDLTSKTAYDPIGISCRICERANCPQRAVPPLKSRLTVHRDRRGILPYDIS